MTLPSGVSVGFLVAATELGMASAARLYVEEIARALGRDGVEAARDEMGREFPVFDLVATRYLETGELAALDPSPLLEELTGVKRALFIGAEADALDAILPRLDGVELGVLVSGGGLEPDAARFAANYERLQVVPLTEWTRWVGARSALITFVYGFDGHVAFVPPAHLRMNGPDVRASFRSIVGFDVLGAPPRLHPRFLAETTELSMIISGLAS